MKKIPKIIHQIWWQGLDKLPKKYHNFRETWINKHPGWKIIYWNKINIYQLINLYYPSLKVLIDDYPLMIQKIDMAKYLILYHYGGFYVDMDTICNKSFNNLYQIKEFQNYDLICSQMEVFPYIKIINNGVIFSKPNNSVILMVINSLKKYKKKEFYQNHDLYVMQSTGPIFFHMIIDEYKNDKTLILPEKFFESCTLRDYPNCKKKGEYLTHQHTLSWTSNIFKYCLNNLNKIENFIISK